MIKVHAYTEIGDAILGEVERYCKVNKLDIEKMEDGFYDISGYPWRITRFSRYVKDLQMRIFD